MVDIYSLEDPITGDIRYIGKAKNSKARFKSHMRDSKRRNTPLYLWIRSLTGQGVQPDMVVLIQVPEDQWEETERFMIAKGREQGLKLLNVADGGDQPFCPVEIRQANGRKNANAIHSDQERKQQWRLRQMIACNLRFLKKHGRIESYERIKASLATKGVYLNA